jgi:hypothetical protein
MMIARTRNKVIAVLLPAFFLIGWLFLGVYKDREFSQRRLFIKNSPTLKFSFYAPLGESDLTLNDLDPTRSQEEVMYRKYIEEGGGYRRSIPLWWK